MARITFNGVTVDPLAPHPTLAAEVLHALDAKGSDYILIQTRQPLDQSQQDELKTKGATILEYIPDSTYLAHYKPTDLAPLRALPFVTWVSVHPQGLKIEPQLLGAGPKVVTLAEVLARPARDYDHTPKTVDVILHNGVEPETVRDAVASAAHLDPKDLVFGAHKVRLRVQLKYLPALAAIDAVRNIEEVTPKKLHNDVARGILRVGLATTGGTFEGEGQLVAVADTGFDRGSTTNVHPAFQGRVQKLYPLGRHGKANDPDGHGTHVAGSVLADGTSGTLGTNIRGTAPQARLLLQSVLDLSGGLGGLPDDLHDLFLPPYQDGARVHTNSWGETVGDGSYNENAREVDDFVWNHRDCVICFAAGNAGRDGSGSGRVDPGSITPPATAKNCITVGATENNRPTFTLTYGEGWHQDFPADPIASDKVADNADGMAAFSSRGPTQAHRVKPDVVGPGTFVLSTLSRDVTDPQPGWGKTGDPQYFYDGGTSMATPLVAGCAAVVVEWLLKVHHLQRPSAALVKALLINGARPIPGQYVPTETGLIPNGVDGFGRVDLAATIGPYAANETVTFKDEATALNTNDQETTSVNVGASLKVTLVWTDPAGDGLQNDLDLIVRAADGSERHGNVDTASSDFDRANNVEQVVWPNVPAGKVDITIRAFRVTQFPQPYALVVRIA
jgi:hypothetical protein